MISVLVTGATTPVGEHFVRSLVADTRVKHVIAVGKEPPVLPPEVVESLSKYGDLMA